MEIRKGERDFFSLAVFVLFLSVFRVRESKGFLVKNFDFFDFF